MDIEALHVPPSTKDFNVDTVANAIAGRFTYYPVPISLAAPAIRGGTHVALGVSTEQRSSLLPQVPTIAEASAVRFDFPIWNASASPTARWPVRTTSGAFSPGWICVNGSRNTEASR